MTQPSMKNRIDQDLSAIEWTKTADTLRKATADKGRAPLMRLRPMVAAALFLVISLGVALAISLSYSPGYEATKKAREALTATYGLTRDSQGFFSASASEKNGEWTVVFKPVDFGEPDKLGSYTVILGKDGEAKASWYYDDKAALAASGALESPVWGQKQLQAYMTGRADYDRAGIATDKPLDLEQAASRDDKLAADFGRLGFGSIRHVTPGPDDLTADEATSLAQDAIMKKYGVTAEGLSAYDRPLQFVKDFDRAEPEYRVFCTDKGQGIAGRQFFEVQIASPSRTILKCLWTGPDAAFPLPAGDLTTHREALDEYFDKGLFDKLPALDKAALAHRVAEAGHQALLKGVAYLAPSDEDMSADDAAATARKALKEQLALEDKGLTLFDLETALVDIAQGATWQMRYVPKTPYLGWDGRRSADSLGRYEVDILDSMGTVTRCQWSLQGRENQSLYGPNNWGKALTYGPTLLPYVADFMAAQKALTDKYPDQDRDFMSVKDLAASDQLFRDAGFPLAQHSHGAPRATDLTLDAAIALAKTAIMQEMTVTSQLLADSEINSHYMLWDAGKRDLPPDATGEKPVWGISFHHNDTGVYTVVMEADTGTVLRVVFDPAAAGNG